MFSKDSFSQQNEIDWFTDKCYMCTILYYLLVDKHKIKQQIFNAFPVFLLSILNFMHLFLFALNCFQRRFLQKETNWIAKTCP